MSLESQIEGRHDAAESQNGTRRAVIWKMDRFASHDGPGIRTTFYFKGCRMGCRWCSNPEGQSFQAALIFQATKCNGCGLCINACPSRAITRGEVTGVSSTVLLNRSKCNSCGDCIPICPTSALDLWGKQYTVADLTAVLEKDRFIHRRSGGGLTCTGGESLCHWEFVEELLMACRKTTIHTAVETCACVEEKGFRAILNQVDLMFIDLKHMDAAKHLELTGQKNDLILNNTRLASSILRGRGKPLVIRMVVIPGVNDGQNVSQLADFLASLPLVTSVELLAYHNYGVYKYGLLGRTYQLAEVRPPTDEMMQQYRRVLSARGLTVT